MRNLKHNSISFRLFAAVAVLCAFFLAYAAWSIVAIETASDIVKETYDRPLQALNYARSANAEFYQLRLLAREGDAPQIASAAREFIDDLGVAGERALDDESRAKIAEIKADFQAWLRLLRPGERQASPEQDALAARIADNFDVLTEIMAASSFMERQRSVTKVDASRRFAAAATAGVFMLAAILAAILSLQITRPLSVAVGIANRISAGERDVEIPTDRKDETGVLLQSMNVMQESIDAMIQLEEDRANSAEHRMFDALDCASSAIILLEADGRIIFANEVVSEYFPDAGDCFGEGKPIGAAIDHISDFLFYAENKDVRRLLLGQLHENEIRLSDGRWLSATRSTTRSGEVVVMWTDITNLKEREESLQVAIGQAEAANAAKSRFLANISHELKTPLNSIIGFSDIIKTEALGPVGAAEYKDYAKYILDGGRRLLEIVQEVLEIARNDQETLKDQNDTEMQPVNIAKILEALCAAYTINNAKVRFEKKFEGAAPWVWGDAELLSHALRNIFSNAVKFTEGSPVVAVSMRAEGPFVEIRVRDNGIGMRAEEIPIALSAFDQANGNLNRRFEGAGIGLPYAKSIIDRHGGEIKIKSALGKGTAVIIRLFDARYFHHGTLSIPAPSLARTA